MLNTPIVGMMPEINNVIVAMQSPDYTFSNCRDLFTDLRQRWPILDYDESPLKHNYTHDDFIDFEQHVRRCRESPHMSAPSTFRLRQTLLSVCFLLPRIFTLLCATCYLIRWRCCWCWSTTRHTGTSTQWLVWCLVAPLSCGEFFFFLQYMCSYFAIKIN